MSDVLAIAPTPEQANQYLDEARRIAAANLLELAKKVALSALDDKASSKTVLDAAEFNYKLSGLAAKQTGATPTQGFKVSFNFNSAKPNSAVTIEAEAVREDPDALPDITPEHILALPVNNDLAADLV